MDSQRQENLKTIYNKIMEKLTEETKHLTLDEESHIVDLYKENHPKFFSRRCNSKINTDLKRLIYELEKRNIISYTCLSSIKEIIEKIKSHTLWELHKDHELLISNSYNVPNTPLVNSSSSSSFLIPEHNSKIFPQVRETICDKVGRSWSKLARSLDIPDAQIDSLEVQHDDISRKTREVLKCYEEKNSQLSQLGLHSKLIDALTTAKRKDIAEEIQKQLYSSCLHL